MATFSSMYRRMRNYLYPHINKNIADGIHKRNIIAVRRISLSVLIIEIIAFIGYLTISRHMLGEPGVIQNNLYAVAVSLIVFLVACYALKDKKHNFHFYRGLGTLYYILILQFAMYVSYYHYVRGRQMMIFFATVFCLVNFLILPPMVGILLVILPYILFYWILFCFDGAMQVNLFNYIIVAIITAAGTVHRFRLQAMELERIYRIETMNNMLQNVPVHDNLTDLKNRYALRDDFNSYQNHHIIVLMLDIEEFTKINELHGEEVGDAVLREIGSKIKKYLPYSTSYRYGADSFLIILQDLELGDALQMLSIWERSMATLTVPGLDESIKYTSGYSHGTPRDEDELRLLIEAADRKRKDYI
ncbi:MAG: GGDEF domain-containing protein [Butyrivibrio sp.]|nr:GGDEF domain-containing protein [Butyrivibrio sp.]